MKLTAIVCLCLALAAAVTASAVSEDPFAENNAVEAAEKLLAEAEAPSSLQDSAIVAKQDKAAGTGPVADDATAAAPAAAPVAAIPATADSAAQKPLETPKPESSPTIVPPPVVAPEPVTPEQAEKGELNALSNEARRIAEAVEAIKAKVQSNAPSDRAESLQATLTTPKTSCPFKVIRQLLSEVRDAMKIETKAQLSALDERKERVQARITALEQREKNTRDRLKAAQSILRNQLSSLESEATSDAQYLAQVKEFNEKRREIAEDNTQAQIAQLLDIQGVITNQLEDRAGNLLMVKKIADTVTL